MAKNPKKEVVVKNIIDVDEVLDTVENERAEEVVQDKAVLTWQEEELLASRANIKERKSDVN